MQIISPTENLMSSEWQPVLFQRLKHRQTCVRVNLKFFPKNIIISGILHSAFEIWKMKGRIIWQDFLRSCIPNVHSLDVNRDLAAFKCHGDKSLRMFRFFETLN